MEQLREDQPPSPARERAILPPCTAAEARERVTRLLELHLGTTAGRVADATVTVADALLVTSELATNAIRHGKGITAFQARIHRDCLVLTIADGSDEMPRRCEPSLTGAPALGGYGWALACRLASRVTVTRHSGGGKSVTAHLPLM
ncbi:hypothetical protein N566_00265 [Streptomycetaceae bacterium MP113-05]|nr:hypothetical protein N566_00265 [Streptomycetaceae bacterium MP113-05]